MFTSARRILPLTVLCLLTACGPIDPSAAPDSAEEATPAEGQKQETCICPLLPLTREEASKMSAVAVYCPGCEPWVCGDGSCDVGETATNCPYDCYCGDGVCKSETVNTCPVDCGCPS